MLCTAVLSAVARLFPFKAMYWGLAKWNTISYLVSLCTLCPNYHAYDIAGFLNLHYGWQNIPESKNSSCFIWLVYAELYSDLLIVHFHFYEPISSIRLTLELLIPLYYSPSSPFFPFPFLTCCVILPNSFGGKGSYLRRWLVAQPLSTVS